MKASDYTPEMRAADRADITERLSNANKPGYDEQGYNIPDYKNPLSTRYGVDTTLITEGMFATMQLHAGDFYPFQVHIVKQNTSFLFLELTSLHNGVPQLNWVKPLKIRKMNGKVVKDSGSSYYIFGEAKQMADYPR